MPNLPSSGQLSMGAIADNQSSASRSNLSLKTQSEAFASGSEVAGSTNQTTARKNLESEPFAISEFFNADFVSDIFSNIDIITVGGGSDKNTVDGEALTIAFDADPDSGDFTVQLVDSGGNVDDTETRSGEGSVTFSTLALDAGTYTPRIRQGFASADGDTITHFDAISGGSTSLTNATQTVSAADESVSNVQITAAVTSGTQEGFKVAQSVVVGGDGGNITSNVNTSTTHTSPQTVTISNPPGQLRFTTTHIGDPSEARNNDSSTADVTITYNRAIDGVGTLDTSNAGKTQFNSGDTIRVFAVSEGVQGVTMKMGYGTANNDTTYTSDDDKSISDSRFVRSSQTFDTSRTLTSGTSLETFFPKANSPSCVDGPSAIISPVLTLSPTLTNGLWLIHVF